MNRNVAAFSIALLLHIILLLLIILLEKKLPQKPVIEKKEEQRIKVSLKENKKAKKDAVIKKNQPIKQHQPMPQGKQLKELVKKPFLKAKPTLEKKVESTPKVEKIKPKKYTPKQPKSKPLPKLSDLLSKKPTKNITKQSDNNITKTTKHQALYDMLSKPTKRVSKEPKKQKVARFTQQIKEAYGSEWGKLSAGEQKYILDNQEIMRRLTQEQLYKTGSVDIPNNLRVNEINIIEFYLHPNGDMSDFKFVSNSNFYLLDDVTRDTIESVYSKYPRPQQKTLIRYKFWYNLRGY